jgi:hypothetical protein
MSTPFKAPSKLLLALELSRCAAELALGYLSLATLVRRLPQGEGRPVIVYPGLATNDWATSLLRHFLDQLGYVTYPWSQGLNKGPSKGLDAMLDTLSDDLRRVHCRHRESVSLVGWSLGGVYARELAKLEPSRVRQVVTMGTPISGTVAGTNGDALFTLLSGSDCHKDPRVLQRVSQAPDVPTTSIYSRTDGVVGWRCSVDASDKVQHVEVSLTSHLGMVASPQALCALANALAQKEQSRCTSRRPALA